MDETVTDGDLTHPVGTPFDRIKLGPGGTPLYPWTVSGGSATQPAAIGWTATADWTGAVVGMSLGTNGTPKRTYFFDAHTAPVTVLNGDTYNVDLT
jgi:hypothetical protein